MRLINKKIAIILAVVVISAITFGAIISYEPKSDLESWKEKQAKLSTEQVTTPSITEQNSKLVDEKEILDFVLNYKGKDGRGDSVAKVAGYLMGSSVLKESSEQIIVNAGDTTSFQDRTQGTSIWRVTFENSDSKDEISINYNSLNGFVFGDSEIGKRIISLVDKFEEPQTMQTYQKEYSDLLKKDHEQKIKTFREMSLDEQEQYVANLVQNYKGKDDKGNTLVEVFYAAIIVAYRNEDILNNPSTEKGWYALEDLTKRNDGKYGIYKVGFVFQTYSEAEEFVWYYDVNTDQIYAGNQAAKSVLDILDSFDK